MGSKPSKAVPTTKLTLDTLTDILDDLLGDNGQGDQAVGQFTDNWKGKRVKFDLQTAQRFRHCTRKIAEFKAK